ncbi:MAG: TIR domain-containing protein [Leptolyngbya sp. LCM1.Bin17]|nr:MAG: TIR domain-containing protein [Leptolyngbya sp. LCM1.Bin17]
MSEANAIFISYRRSDSNDVSGRIYDRLAAHFGKAVIFKDVHSIPYGVDFPTYIQQELGKCQVLLAVIGLTWLTVERDGQRRLEDPKDWVRIEIETALENSAIVVIPVLAGGALMPKAEELPDRLKSLSRLHSAQARPDPDFHQDMKRLVRHLKEILEPGTGHPPPAPEHLSASRRRFYERQRAQLEDALAAVESDLETAPRAVDRLRLEKEAERLLEKIDDLNNKLQG